MPPHLLYLAAVLRDHPPPVRQVLPLLRILKIEFSTGFSRSITNTYTTPHLVVHKYEDASEEAEVWWQPGLYGVADELLHALLRYHARHPARPQARHDGARREAGCAGHGARHGAGHHGGPMAVHRGAGDPALAGHGGAALLHGDHLLLLLLL